MSQANYSAAKAGIAAFTIVAAAELGRYGILANGIAPSARSRMTEEAFAEMMRKPEGGFDAMDPANVTPLVVWLGCGECDVTGRMFEIAGGELSVADGWQHGDVVDKGARYEPAEVGGFVATDRRGPRRPGRIRVLTVVRFLLSRANVPVIERGVLAADGRVIGARAQHTRRRLLETTSRLLDERGVMELKVVDVTREVGTSPATFYQYFADVDAAILALSDDAAEDEAAPLLRPPGLDWAGRTAPRRGVRRRLHDLLGRARVLRIRNLKAEEGDRGSSWPARRANVFMVEAMGWPKAPSTTKSPGRRAASRRRSTRSAPARRWWR